MNYPTKAIQTKAELQQVLNENGKVYGVECYSRGSFRLTRFPSHTWVKFGGAMGFNLDGPSCDSFAYDFLFANYWDAWAYANKMRRRAA